MGIGHGAWGFLRGGKGKEERKRIITNAQCPLPIAHCLLSTNNQQPTINN
ncbi:hypothetical protein [Tolypothrix sp. VBCCA 56010]